LRNSIALIFSLLITTAQAQEKISIIFPEALLDTGITSLAIADTKQLLESACGCDVSLNNPKADVLIMLPAIDEAEAALPNRFAREAKFPYKNFPGHDYSWQLKRELTHIELQLNTTSWQGISCGLYGLLQEKLGFKFYHPRQTIVPHWTSFPLQKPFLWQAKALFDKKGFHLHTEHPTELTEQLHDGTLPNALEDVKEYIDWLARNGQNYFEFCLLESIDRKEWPAHGKAIVDYCHQRGIQAAVDLSLHMIQQKTFQLYVGPAAKKKQIEKNLQWLMQADWDFINMEFSTAEFIAGNKRKKEALRLFIIDWLQKNTHTKLMGRQHVVRHENEAGHKRKDFEWDSASAALDKERGVLSHTVMFYDMTEPNAPVYENKNQRHQYDFLLQQMQLRETWYYPESAYWVTFDNSVPMFLLPYLSARLSDIDTCVQYNVPGHITFSSGWEWGYWLFDWSIARWCWQHTTDGIAEKRFPEMFAYEMLETKEEKDFLSNALQLQQEYLKDSSLMQWMTAMTITDEIGIKALNDAYHPRPELSYKFLQRKASPEQLEATKRKGIEKLEQFAAKTFLLTPTLFTDSISNEFQNGIRITALRAKHRAAVLQYIICKRAAQLKHEKCYCDTALDIAYVYRREAQAIVNQRQQRYRYPLSLIAEKRWDHTAYHFGYLYPVSQLHFWKREEEEALKNKYSPLFMNIWNMWRIAGIIN